MRNNKIPAEIPFLKVTSVIFGDKGFEKAVYMCWRGSHFLYDEFKLKPSWEGLARRRVFLEIKAAAVKLSGGGCSAYWAPHCGLHMTHTRLPTCLLAYTGSRSIKSGRVADIKIQFLNSGVLENFCWEPLMKHFSVVCIKIRILLARQKALKKSKWM